MAEGVAQLKDKNPIFPAFGLVGMNWVTDVLALGFRLPKLPVLPNNWAKARTRPLSGNGGGPEDRPGIAEPGAGPDPLSNYPVRIP